MIGVITDIIAIIVGGSIGFLAKKAIPDAWSDIILKGLGLVSIYIGVDGALVGENPLIAIVSIALGAMIGEGFKIEQRFNHFAQRMEEKMDAKGGKTNFAQGFVTFSLMACVGAMVVMGPLDAGLRGDNTLLFTKTAIDGVGSIVFAASLGIGVIFSAGPVLVVEGGIFLLAGLLAPVLPEAVINEITCVGSILIIAMGLNLTVDTKLKLMNYMPAILLPIGLCPLFDWVSSLI